MKNNRKRNNLNFSFVAAGGFTLIEVLIAVFVLAVGMLGVAGMQGLGVRESQNSYFRTQADMLASDMADRMRANRAAAAAVPSTTDYLFDGTTVTNDNCLGTGVTCSESNLAGYDVLSWRNDIQNSNLPGGVGTITRTAGTTNEYTIMVFWDEDRDGGQVATAASCNPDSGDGCIRLVVEI